MPAQPLPEGFQNVAPLLYVRDAATAIDFYERAFGAQRQPVYLTYAGDKVAHAEIKIGDSIVMLAQENPDWGNRSPQTLGGTSVGLHLYVEDVDETFQRALDAGATVQIPVQNQFYGDRTGRIVDPYGHVWIIATHFEDMTAEEMQRRMDEWMQKMGG